MPETIIKLQPLIGWLTIGTDAGKGVAIDVRHCSESDLALAERLLVGAARAQLREVSGRALPGDKPAAA